MNADERRWDADVSSNGRVADAASCERFARLCRMTGDMLAIMTPAERDRMMQEHLAAARGPQRNLQLLCEMTRALLAIRARNRNEETKGDSDGD